MDTLIKDDTFLKKVFKRQLKRGTWGLHTL